MPKKKTDETKASITAAEEKNEASKKANSTEKAKNAKAEPEKKNEKVFGTVDRDKVFAEVMGYDLETPPGETDRKKAKAAPKKKPAKKKAPSCNRDDVWFNAK